jgi:ATP-dependent DNA ligase
MIGVPKPKKQLKSSHWKKLNSVWIQRKYDGCCVFGVTPKQLFSRRTSKVSGRKIPYEGKFPHISEEMSMLPLPEQTAIVGEMTWFDENGLDVFRMIQRMTGSGDSNSLALQQKHGSPIWMLYELLFLHKKQAFLLPYRKRYEILETALAKTKPRYIKLIENIDMPVGEAYKMSKKKGWEGLVIKDPEGITEVNLDDTDNRAPRPNIAWKLIPSKIAEVVIVGYNLGTGANAERVGHVIMKMWHRGKKKFVPVGEVGIFEGFTQDIRDELAERKHIWNGKYFEYVEPLIAKVRYKGLTDKNKLFHPVLVAFTNEKNADECVFEEEFEGV